MGYTIVWAAADDDDGGGGGDDNDDKKFWRNLKDVTPFVWTSLRFLQNFFQ